MARVLFALSLITFVALLTYLGRDGYVDPEDDSISLLDAFYYSTVTITTTGYGDIRPVSDYRPPGHDRARDPSANHVPHPAGGDDASRSSPSAAGRPTDGQDGGST